MNRKYIIPLILALVLAGGILIGNWYSGHFSNTGGSIHSLLQKKNSSKEGDVSFSLLPRTNKITSILSYIENEYVDTVNVNKLTEAAIPTIIDELDPHSVYIPSEELQKYNEPLVGNFSGIGIQFNMNDDTVAVVNTIPNGPSEIVGLQAGDRIIKVNGEVIAGKDLPTDSIVNKLRGEKGSMVKVSVLRRGVNELLEFEITRDDIPLYSVDVAYMMDDSVGYMKISTFSQTTSQEFAEGINKLHGQGMKKLILDLRSNGGGVMEAATNIADHFLTKNKLIVYTQGKSRPRYDIYATEKGICENDEVVVLIDEFSASASEIVAGAIQDNDRGTIIGRRSFGKGLVQEQIEFRDGSALRLTIARYYTPTGRSIQRPYTNGKEEYYEDLHHRLENGELVNADSIHFADSLKYTTPGGKTVYGGGGIMPDIFVPIDTSGITPYFNLVRNRGLIYRFSFNYTDLHREEMKQLISAEEINRHLERTDYFNRFIRYAQSEGVKPNWGQINTSKEILTTQIKAYIARNLIDNEGFYPIIEDIDVTLQKAFGLLKEG